MTTSPVITRTEQINWQRQAAIVLGRLLDMAAREDLPVISWTVAHAGARVVGTALNSVLEERRADWTAWRDALGAPDTEHEQENDGVIRLSAKWDRGAAGRGQRPLLSDREGYQMASVVLVADIYPADDEGPGAWQR